MLSQRRSKEAGRKNNGKKPSRAKDRTQSGLRAGLIAQNRRARHDYTIENTIETGLVLQGTEIKSLRRGKANLAHAYVRVDKGEAYLINADIPEYAGGNQFNHKPNRPRKLLLHRREINKLHAAVQREGATLIPLKLYFNQGGYAKLLVGTAKGRKKTDKREHEKARDWQRDKARLLRKRN